MSSVPAFQESPLRERAVKRGKTLEYVTIGYNCLEGVISLIAGFFAGSVALVGFGFDSLIEVSSGAAVLWRLHLDSHPTKRERAERLSLRAVGVCFLVLAGYILWDAGRSLFHRQAPERSLPGIVLAAVSLVVMPMLAAAKRSVAASLNSQALSADARQTDFCTYLSAVLLGGLLLNALLGWWWADPVAALVMAPLIAAEGFDALRGKTCCGCSHANPIK